MVWGGDLRRSTLLAATALAGIAVAALLMSAPAKAESNGDATPLGLLISPGTEQAPAAAPADNSYDGSALDNPGRPETAPSVEAMPKNLPATPLGTLIAPEGGSTQAAPAASSAAGSSGSSSYGSALDTTPAASSRPAPAPMPGQYPALGARPLGILLSPSPSTPRPAGSSTSGVRTAATPSPSPQPTAATPRPTPEAQAYPAAAPATPTAPREMTAPAAEGVPAPQATSSTPAAAPGRAAEVIVPAAKGGKQAKHPPIDFYADSMTYDQQKGIVTARGNVVVVRQGNRLVANEITYNQKTDVVTARGNVALFEPNGERLYGNYIELTGDMKDGVIQGIGVILQDHSRLAAAGARRSGGNLLVMNKAVYSPCNLCASDPNAPPLWQIKAVRITHNKAQQVIQYRDAWFEVAGIPVAYTPYFQHPDPTVKRRSGLLAPSFGSSSDLGGVFKTPYYWNINRYSDATITPLITTSQGKGVITEYRQNFAKGEINGTGSMVLGDTERSLRGHIRGSANFDVNPTWRWGLKVDRASDDTYLRRYGFQSDSYLTSRLFTEGFRGRNYFSANAYTFQGLEASDSQSTTPIVLPMLNYNHVGKPDAVGGHTTLDANFLTLTRRSGTDMRRLSLHPGWDLPFADTIGGRYNFSVKLLADGYHVSNVERNGNSDFTGFTGRLVPQAKLDWRMPFVRPSKNVDQIVEPIASLVVSPYGGNPQTIPNQDSQETEFDDTNLFSANRFSGLDRVEGGPRLNYGMKWGVYGKNGGSTSVLVGQTYRPRVDNTFGSGTGLNDQFSDVVSRVDISPGKWVDLLYRTEFNPRNLTPSRNEVQTTVGSPALRMSTNYLFLGATSNSEYAAREELTLNLDSQVNRNWRTGLSGVRDLAANEARSMSMYVNFENECLVFRTTLQRTFYQDRDLKPSDSIFFRIILKTLGQFGTGQSLQ